MNNVVIGINPNIAEDRKKLAVTQNYDGSMSGTGRVYNALPPSPVSAGVDGQTYGAYRKGLDSGCVDIVVTTTDPTTKINYVIAGLRGPDKCFPNTWWMHGGALYAYCAPDTFVAERAQKECKVMPTVEAYMCTVRTCCDRFAASTIQPCYVGRVPFEAYKLAEPDPDHSKVRLVSLPEVQKEIEEQKLHWYPALAFRLALTTM